MKIHLIILFLICAFCNGKAQTYFEYVDSADNLIKQEKWAQAENVVISALKSMPANKLNYLLWSNLGEIRIRQENTEGALEAFTIGLASSPNNTSLLIKRASAYLSINRVREGMEDIDNCLRIDSTLLWPLKMKGLLLLDNCETNDNFSKEKLSEKLHEAETYFMKLKKLDSNSYEAYLGLGKIEAMRGNSVLAERYFRKSIELKPDNLTYFYLILLNIENNNPVQAKSDLSIALKRYPKDGNLFLLRAAINKITFQNEAALADKKIAINYGADPHLVDRFFSNYSPLKSKK